VVLYARKYNWIFFVSRYKIATEHLEKGLLFLKREVKFEVHPWPGTNNIIPETTRNGLEVCWCQMFGATIYSLQK
jgi:hypothetical protein